MEINWSDDVSPAAVMAPDPEVRRREAVEAIARGVAALRPLERMSVEVQGDGTYVVTFTAPTPAY